MRSLPRSLLAGIGIAAVLLGCGVRQGQDTGAIGPDVTKQLQDLLLARASAMASGNREAFIQTIDQSRPALRRSQLREFEYPSSHGGLTSTFKITSVERYGSYLRAWIEERIDGNVFPDAFPNDHAYTRRYFRSDAGRWVISEPTADERGSEIVRAGSNVELTYWAMDEDVADVLLGALVDAHDFALRFAPRPLTFMFRGTFVPTAEIAGPGWDAFVAYDPPPRLKNYPQWYGFDNTRTHVSEYVRMSLRSFALQQLRDASVPGLSAVRLSGDSWLNFGWGLYNAGVDIGPTLKHACEGVPVLTLQQLSNGPPDVGDPGVSPDTYARYYGYGTSMTGYLLERFGPDGYWRLMAAYAQNPSGAANFRSALGLSREDFYASWLAWVKTKYC